MGKTRPSEGSFEALYRLAFPRPDLYFVAYEDGTLFPLTDDELLYLLTGESVHGGCDHLRVGEVQCRWVDTEVRSKTLGFRCLRWARIRLNHGRATPDVVSRSRKALTGPHPILDHFGPHAPWDPTPSEWKLIKLELSDRAQDYLWLILAMGLGFEFDGDPQDLRARRLEIHTGADE
jgi:hypothetical protein